MTRVAQRAYGCGYAAPESDSKAESRRVGPWIHMALVFGDFMLIVGGRRAHLVEMGATGYVRKDIRGNRPTSSDAR